MRLQWRCWPVAGGELFRLPDMGYGLWSMVYGLLSRAISDGSLPRVPGNHRHHRVSARLLWRS